MAAKAKPAKYAQQAQPQIIRLSGGLNHAPNITPAHVRIDVNQPVEWVSVDVDYTIDFDGDNPFPPPSQFTVPGRSSLGRQPRTGTNRPRAYKYSVASSGGFVDPDIKIDP